MAIDPGTYFGNVVITVLTVLTFFILVLAFLYMIWGREETTPAQTKPKTKPIDFFYESLFRSKKNTIKPTIVKTTANSIAKKACGPAPKIIGIGPMNITRTPLAIESP